MLGDEKGNPGELINEIRLRESSWYSPATRRRRSYAVFFLRRATTTANSTIASAAATARITVTVSIAFLLSDKKRMSGYLKMPSRLFEIRMMAGPSSTMKMLGKINSTSGKMSLTVVLAAISSAC